MGPDDLLRVGVFCGLLLSFGGGCGESSSDANPAPPGMGGVPSSGSSGGPPHAGSEMQCQGPGCAAGGSGSTPQPLSEASACRAYFTAVCARIRECNAPKFRPCESPIDACPDMLFSEGSRWTLDAVVACTADWKTHSCEALNVDRGPACSQVPGARAKGDACAFDAQCAGNHCSGGIVPGYQPTCGVCADVAPSHGACDAQLVCPPHEACGIDGVCVDQPVLPDPLDDCQGVSCPDGTSCKDGVCAQRSVGDVCTRLDYQCGPGLACQIELVADEADEPTEGTCQALPAIGSPCLPTFTQTGLCVDGGTCDGRPTGSCVALREVGASCGYTSCVEGAYCNVLGYDLGPSHTCIARGPVGTICDYTSSDQGNTACAEGLACVCTDGVCDLGVCAAASAIGEACSEPTVRCSGRLVCQGGICVDSGAPSGSVESEGPCLRSTAFGREFSSCKAGLECLCLDATCTKSQCATARNAGEACNGKDQLCRQGLACESGKCAEGPPRDLDGKSCPATP